MNQIMRVGKGIVIAMEGDVPRGRALQAMSQWKDALPGVPIFIVPRAEIVQLGTEILFSFNGDVSPETVAEFRSWWESARSNGGQDD